MAAVSTTAAPATSPYEYDVIPPLENGSRLSAREFMRRYQAMPEVAKAELINGIVYMASPTRIELHGEPDNLMQGWLCNYAIATRGIKAATNSTIRLGPDDVAQPDGLLRILPECGGQSRPDSKEYLKGGPELVMEVAASSVSLDARDKLVSYRRACVREYLMWRTEEDAVDWWVLDEDEFTPLTKGTDGIIKSKTLPGLWLDTNALLAGDGAKLMLTLQEGLRSAEYRVFAESLQRP